MIIKLLDNTRKINRLLQEAYTNRIEFEKFAALISEILEANVLIISNNAKILASSFIGGNVIDSSILSQKIGDRIDVSLNDRLLNVLSTKENVNLRTLGFDEKYSKIFRTMIIPVDMASKRLATLFMYREEKEFLLDDIIIGEYGSTVIGLELARSINEEKLERDSKVLYVKSAINTLSYSEKNAIGHIFDELDGKEGILVASKVADKHKITRSVIVNAIRKCESAGVIESKSLGMKGTFIKIINEYFLEEIKNNK